MIPDTVMGLPVHPLLVHAPVVLIPLSALGLILIVVVPRFRPQYGTLVAIGCVLSFLSAWAAELTGQDFEERLEESGQLGGEVAEKVADHAALGQTMPWFGLALAIVGVAFVVLTRRGAAKNVILAVSILAVIVAGATTVQLVRTGHAGATAVFNPAG